MEFPFKNKAMLAPMSGFTDVAFRELCLKYGASLTFTEFVSSNAIVQNNKKTKSLLKTSSFEKPCAVQIFGSNSDILAKAVSLLQDDFDYIDFNCGCPAKKLAKSGSGAELLKNPQKIKELLSSMINVSKKPISLKVRLGISDNLINIFDVTKIAQDVGCSWVTIHGRTKEQGYSGKSNWELIKLVKEKVTIPVIGNGDIKTPEEFKLRLTETGVDAIMIGRGALGNPYLFKQIKDYMETGVYDSKSGIMQFLEYLELAKKYGILFNEIKNHAMFFTKGIVGGSEVRQMLVKSKSLDEIEQIVAQFHKP